MTERVLRQLEFFMRDCLSDAEIQDVCFYYFADLYEELKVDGLTKSKRLREVLAYVRRRKMTAHLVAALYERHGDQMNEEFPDGLEAGVTVPAVPVTPAVYERNPRQIFLSHANQDAEFARRLADDLELEGWQVWLAPDSIEPGEQWAGAIERGLATSGVFLLVLSPDAVASRWVQTEMNVAIDLNHAGEMAIVPLLFRPCKQPYLWRAYQHLRFTRGAYPLPTLLARLGDKATPEAPVVPTPTVAPQREPEIVVTPPPKLVPPAFDGLEWVEIPAGEFWMGDDKGDSDEKPCHRLHLDTFWIAKTPVTNAQWRTFVQATRHEKPKHWQKGQIPKGKEQHPVVTINWHEAREYCLWLEAQIGWPINLPSEAEWEKAARGSADKRRYPWGEEFNKYKCNTDESGIGDTTPVDKYPAGASPYGVLDMSGNVWEWTRSLIKPYPYDPQDGREDVGADGSRGLRGGSWFYQDNFARAASRNHDPYPRFDDLVGFRVVVVRPPSHPAH
jgi:formylglycine-generating enzyme required for sulfatase activity